MYVRNRKNTGIKLVGIVSLMILTFRVAANDQDTRPAELAFYDEKLNDIYNNILGRLESYEKVKLKKSQHAWIAFRDLDCAWAFPAEPLDCMIERTGNREKELRQTYFFDNKGNYLSVESKIE